MTGAEIELAFEPLAVLPLLILAAGIVMMLCALVVARRRDPFAGIDPRLGVVGVVTTLAAAAVSLAWTTSSSPQGLGRVLAFDAMATVTSALILLSAAVATLLSVRAWRRRAGQAGDGHLLTLTTCLGALVTVSSEHFIALLLGIELMSVSLYPLLAFDRDRPGASGAAITYLVMGGMSAAALVLGAACVLLDAGTASLEALGEAAVGGPLARAGFGLVFLAVAFKLAIAPFHGWVGPVYGAAPRFSVMLVATVSKMAVVGVAARYLAPGLGSAGALVAPLVLAGLAMVVGYLLALREHDPVRVVGYASIAHLGYLLAAVLVAGQAAQAAVVHYLVAYAIAALGLLGVVVAAPTTPWRGLGRRHPGLGVAAAICLLSLAGLPPTLGLLAKLHVVLALVARQAWAVLGALVVSSLLGVFVYLRLARELFDEPSDTGPKPPAYPGIAAAVALLAVASVIGTLWAQPADTLAGWLGVEHVGAVSRQPR